MHQIDFMANIEARYGSAQSNSANRDDIADLIKRLSSNQLDLIWKEFINSYAYNSPPKRAHFYKIMKEMGITPKSEKLDYYWWVCDNCGRPYSMESRACPNCKARERSLHSGNSYPQNIMMAHALCYECPKYQSNQYCKYWGKFSPKERPEWMSNSQFKQQVAMCRDCACRDCCQVQRLYKNDYLLYRERFIWTGNGEEKVG